MDLESAKQLVLDSLNENYLSEDNSPVVTDYKELKKGWLIYYNGKLFVELNDPQYIYVGNAPVFVNRNSGEIIQLSSGESVETQIKRLGIDS